MPAHPQTPVSYRCPLCLAKEIDVVLHHTPGGRYYCTKCSFAGTEAEIRELYSGLQKKFRLSQVRLTLQDIERL